MAVALACAAAFVGIERRVKDPMLPTRLARNKVLGSMALAGAAINLTFYGAVFVFSIYFQTFLHYDAFKTGVSFIPLTAVLTLSTLLSSRFAKRFSATRIITTGFSVQIVGFLVLSQITAQASPVAAQWRTDAGRHWQRNVGAVHYQFDVVVCVPARCRDRLGVDGFCQAVGRRVRRCRLGNIDCAR